MHEVESSLRYWLLIGSTVGAIRFGLEAGQGRLLGALTQGLLWFILATLALGALHSLGLMLWPRARRLIKRLPFSPRY